ncbi:MAG TPA: hypothetical protein VER32_07540 [Pyrinomonadaceae bacterium]|nr:hypothetical protein [Pyrinomonadaceae bacterium]
MAIEGIWNLEVATPFGKHPATLVIERNGGSLGGRIDSRLGSIPLEDASASGEDEFEAGVSYEVRGQTYRARISGRSEGDRIEGKIKVNLPIAPPARYTGTRGS